MSREAQSHGRGMPDQELPVYGKSGHHRSHERQNVEYWACLTPMMGGIPIHCEVDNAGEGGLYLVASASDGLMVGGRYEVTVGEVGCPENRPNVLGEGHYGTITRSEPLSTDQTRDDEGEGALLVKSAVRVGFGLRFDRPTPL